MRNSLRTGTLLVLLMAAASDRVRGEEAAPAAALEIRQNQEDTRPVFMPVFRLQNAKAADLQQVVGPIAAWLAEKPGGVPSQVPMVVADLRTNSLIVLTRSREELERLAEIIKKLDAVVTEPSPALPAKPAQ